MASFPRRDLDTSTFWKIIYYMQFLSYDNVWFHFVNKGRCIHWVASTYSKHRNQTMCQFKWSLTRGKKQWKILKNVMLKNGHNCLQEVVVYKGFQKKILVLWIGGCLWEVVTYKRWFCIYRGSTVYCVYSIKVLSTILFHGHVAWSLLPIN